MSSYRLQKGLVRVFRIKVKDMCNADIIRQAGPWMMLLIMIAAGVVACAPGGAAIPDEGNITLSLSSPALQEGEDIPTDYTCDGQDMSPPLTWDEPPSETQSFALIMDDLDAPGGVFTHWVLFNIPADSRELQEAVPAESQLSSGALQGKNSFGKTGYGGPCPPAGNPHQYQFTLYALDQLLDLHMGASKNEVFNAMQGHILGQGRLTATYQR
jgi:hypothetical protein